MEHLVNSKVKGIEISGIRKFFNMVAQYDDVISLSIGQPDFFTPNHVKEAGKEAIESNKSTYTHNAGLIELRKAAANFVHTKYDLKYSAETEVITTTGASEAIDISFRTILEEGCEVILPGPVYPGYEPIIRLCGAVPVYIDTTNSNFKLTAQLIDKYLTEKTRCIVLPYPSNPTGCILNSHELQEIADLVKDKDIFILSDEIYSELVYHGEHRSIAALPGMKEKTIVINGLSKSHAMTGWRIGFLFASANIAKHILKVHQYNVTCPSSISQYAALEALTNGLNDANAMKQEYIKRLHYVCKRLNFMGIEIEEPSGAFYVFPSIEKFGLTSLEFATKLVQEAGLAVVPGDAFSPLGEGFVRISYAYSMETLEAGLDRLEKFIKTI